MVHLDVKKVGVIPDGSGWRVHGRGSEQVKQVGPAKNTATGKSAAQRSCTHLHSAVDGFSRLTCTEAPPELRPGQWLRWQITGSEEDRNGF